MICSHGFWSHVDHVRLIIAGLSRIFRHATTTKKRFSYLTCLRINLLFHPRTQQQKHEKATEHIALLANGHLNDSMFIIVCKIPTASSDRRLFFFKSHHQFLNKNNNKDILFSFLTYSFQCLIMHS